MRRRSLLPVAGLAALILAVLPAARSQDNAPSDGVPTYHWPNRTIGIPVDADALAKVQPKPSALQLYSSLNRGKWQPGPKLAPNEMKPLDGGKSGFLFAADRDGEYEFAVQFLYPDGSASPKAEELAPQRRVVIDTVPPQVRVQSGSNWAEWIVTDDNLDPRTVVLQARLPGGAWQTITDRSFKPADRYAWAIRQGQVIEVRVSAKDRAGNEGFSPVVRVPGDAAVGTAFPKAPVGNPDWPPTGGGGRPDPITGAGGGALPQPRIEYANTKDLKIDYTIQRMGRSGVKAAYLFTQKPGANWDEGKKFDVNLTPTERDPSLSLPYVAEAEGVYGFYVIPESGAGVRAPNPRRDDPPMVLVVVDWTKPYVKITGVQVRPGGTRGPLVDITWEVADPNLMTDGVSLEYSVDRSAVAWKEIKYRAANDPAKEPGRYTGRYTWEVPDESVWKFWVRIRAVDKAANTGEHVWDKEVIVDLEKPAAGITGVRGGNTPGGPPSSPPAGGGGLPGGGSPSRPSTLPPAGGTPGGPSGPTGPALPPLPGDPVKD